MTTFALLVAAFILVVILPCMAANLILNLRRPAGFPPAASPMTLGLAQKLA